ncbi:ferredoxin-type protein NapF [Erwinia sp. CPCC 100877]|nr:ferredoxin-type protein NapF [Erwinia sp. CPCC 100877]
MTQLSRRGLLTGWRRSTLAIRPPWSGSEAGFIERCTRCGACATACESAIIHSGTGGYPEIDFHNGECTFCYSCAQACPEALFVPRDSAPWSLRVVVGDGCLARQRVDCRSCEDSCEPQALRFMPSRDGVATLQIDASRCTGCGACVAGCLVSALSLRSSDEQ